MLHFLTKLKKRKGKGGRGSHKQTTEREEGGREGGWVGESVKNDTFISSKDQGKLPRTFEGGIFVGPVGVSGGGGKGGD